MKYRVVYRFRGKYPVQQMCELFQVSRSGYYAWASRFGREDPDKNLAELISVCQEKSRKTYGYRRVRIWILREYGLVINHKAVLRIMNKYGLLSEVRRRRKPENIVADVGYGSEENYEYIEREDSEAYVKYSTYEMEQKRSFAKKAYRVENLPYHEAEDEFECHAGKRLRYIGTQKQEDR